MGIEEARKLAKVLAELAASEDSANVKAAILDAATRQIAAASAGTWQSAHFITTDGSHLFAGRLGEIVVIAKDGSVYKGRGDAWRVSRGGIELDYGRLVKL